MRIRCAFIQLRNTMRYSTYVQVGGRVLIRQKLLRRKEEHEPTWQGLLIPIHQSTPCLASDSLKVVAAQYPSCNHRLHQSNCREDHQSVMSDNDDDFADYPRTVVVPRNQVAHATYPNPNPNQTRDDSGSDPQVSALHLFFEPSITRLAVGC